MINLNQDQIGNLLADLIKKRFNMDFDINDESLVNKKLLGNEIGMKPRDLLYLFCDIENEFGIQIPQEAIITGKFDTLANIVEIIDACKKEAC